MVLTTAGLMMLPPATGAPVLRNRFAGERGFAGACPAGRKARHLRMASRFQRGPAVAETDVALWPCRLRWPLRELAGLHFSGRPDSAHRTDRERFRSGLER